MGFAPCPAVDAVEVQVLEQARAFGRDIRATSAALAAALQGSRQSVFPRDWCDLKREWRADGSSDGDGGVVDTEQAQLTRKLGRGSAWASEPVRRAAHGGWRRCFLPLTYTCNLSVMLAETTQAMVEEPASPPSFRRIQEARDGAAGAVGGGAAGDLVSAGDADDGMSNGDGCASRSQDSDAVERAERAGDVGGDSSPVVAEFVGAVLGGGCNDWALCVSCGCSREFEENCDRVCWCDACVARGCVHACPGASNGLDDAA